MRVECWGTAEFREQNAELGREGSVARLEQLRRREVDGRMISPCCWTRSSRLLHSEHHANMWARRV